jgi:CheY-like chemotaxis protein
MTTERRFEILLAEDNRGDSELVREALSQHKINCSLHVVRDGAQAIQFINAMDQSPGGPGLDLLLIDMRLPKCDGEEVLRRLRSSPRGTNIPAVVMTGESSTGIEKLAHENSAMVFKKSSNLEEFMRIGEIVGRVLEGRSPANSAESGGEV